MKRSNKATPKIKWEDESQVWDNSREHTAHLLRVYRKPEIRKTHIAKRIARNVYSLTSKYPRSPTMLIFTKGAAV